MQAFTQRKEDKRLDRKYMRQIVKTIEPSRAVSNSADYRKKANTEGLFAAVFKYAGFFRDGIHGAGKMCITSHWQFGQVRQRIIPEAFLPRQWQGNHEVYLIRLRVRR